MSPENSRVRVCREEKVRNCCCGSKSWTKTVALTQIFLCLALYLFLNMIPLEGRGRYREKLERMERRRKEYTTLAPLDRIEGDSLGRHIFKSDSLQFPITSMALKIISVFHHNFDSLVEVAGHKDVYSLSGILLGWILLVGVYWKSWRLLLAWVIVDGLRISMFVCPMIFEGVRKLASYDDVDDYDSVLGFILLISFHLSSYAIVIYHQRKLLQLENKKPATIIILFRFQDPDADADPANRMEDYL